MKTAGIVVLMLAVFWQLPCALADTDPAFATEDCSWDSTHIIVVTEGTEIDGVLTVMESWKGDLKKGDSITIPRLSSFAAESSRQISYKYIEKQPNSPTHVTGSMMVLFLKKKEATEPERDRVEKESGKQKTSWAPGDRHWDDWSYGSVKVCIAWIEDGKVYAFRQMYHFRPSEITPLEMSETQMKSKVLEVLKIKDGFTEALKVRNPAKRAKALEPYARCDVFHAWWPAFDVLAKCGEPALPILRKMLGDFPEYRHHTVIKALGKAGGKKVGPELTVIVEKELVFWKKRAPTLQEGWWAGYGLKGGERGQLQDRVSNLKATLEALKDIGFASCKKVVTELRDFWASLPQLQEDTAPREVIKLCDVLLKELQKK